MKNDSRKLLIALFLTILAVYGLPRIGFPVLLNQVIFLIITFYVFYSKDDIFWLCWYFMILDAPGRLFLGGYAANVYRLPIYSISTGISLAFSDIFLLMYIVKSFRNRYRVPYMFSRQIWLLITIGALYFGISFVIGISFTNIVQSVRMIMPWLWVLIVPRYINKSNDLVIVFKMLYPILILSFLSLIFTYFTGTYLHNALSGITSSRLFEASEENLARVYSAAYLSFVCTTISLYFLSQKKPIVNPNLLIFVAFLGSLTLFLSGTRGWMITLFIVYSAFFFISGFSLFKQMIRLIVIVGLLTIILISVFPVISSQSNLAFQRLLTLESFAEGDVTAGGTLIRITERSPRVMAEFNESKVIGWAFSDRFHAYADGHVGNQTNLLNLGIIGFIAILMIYIMICFKTFSYGRKKNRIISVATNSGVFLFALFGLFFAHSTSGMLWGFGVGSNAIYLLWAFLLSAINAEINPDYSLLPPSIVK